MLNQTVQNFTIKSIKDDEVIISGYASVYNIVDHQNDITIKGSINFNEPSKIKFLWQHDKTKPIGVIKSLIEDEYGLQVEAAINCNISSGFEAMELVRQGAVNGLSVGFNIKSAYFNKLGQRIIEQAELVEVSIVTFPANAQAQILNITKNIEEGAMNLNINEERINKQINMLDIKINNIQKFLSRPEIEIDQDNEYKSAFCDYIRKGNINSLVKKSFTSQDGEGEVLIVPTLYNKIISEMNARSPLRQLATIETISTNALDVVIEEGKLSTGWVGDNENRPDTKTSKLHQKRILVHELYAQPKATQALIDDSAIQIESWLSEKLRDSFVQAENEAFINGNGVKQPKGILHADQKMKSIKCKDRLVDSLLDMINDLDESYLANATFLMNRTTLSEIQKLKDGNDRFIWQPTISEAIRQTIFGMPVICCSEMPSIGDDKCAIAFGDFKSAYKIIDRSGINIMRDPYTDKPFIKFYAVKRVGGDIVNPEAIRLGKF